jgi:hypothetical protein
MPDRYERMARVRENSPASDSFWARELGFTNLDELTPGQLEEISVARRAYFAELRVKSLRGIKRAQANRLRQRADILDAEAEAGA